MSRLPLGVIWTVIGALLVAATVGLVFGPGRGMRGDIADQKALVTRQLRTTLRQLEISEEQLALSQEQLKLAKEQLALARSQLAKTDESLEMQRRMLAIAEESLRHMREIDRKTPDAQRPASVATGR